MSSTSEFNGLKWALSNGIKEDMQRSQIKEILGEGPNDDYYNWKYETDVAFVHLFFSHRQSAGESESAYNLYGITIRKKQEKAPGSAPHRGQHRGQPGMALS
jgi:hypothetical protein